MNALPDLLARLAKATARSLRTDSAIIAPHLLAVCAGAIGASRVIEIKPDWCEACAIWAGVIAPPGSIKSEAWRIASAPLERLEDEADERTRDAEALYERAVAEWESRKKTRKGRPDPEDPRPEPPGREQIVAGDCTREALVETLAANPRGIVLSANELDTFIAGLNQYKKQGNDESFYISCYDGAPYTANRKTSGAKYVRLRRPTVSILGTIQPDTLRAATLNMSGLLVGRGLIPRFIFAMPPVAAYTWTDDCVSGEAREMYARVVRNLAELRVDEDGEPVVVRLSGKARDVLKRFVDELADDWRAAESSAAQSVIGKGRGLAARIALVIHEIEDGGQVVGTDAMEAAVQIARWTVREARRVSVALGEVSEADAERRRLEELIERRGGTITVRDLMRGPRLYRGDHKAAEAALDDLARTGIADWESPPPGDNGGAPARVLRLRGLSGDGGDGDDTPRQDSASKGYVAVATSPRPGATPTSTGEGRAAP